MFEPGEHLLLYSSTSRVGTVIEVPMIDLDEVDQTDINTVIVIIGIIEVGRTILIIIEGVVEAVFMVSRGKQPWCRRTIGFKSVKPNVTDPAIKFL